MRRDIADLCYGRIFELAPDARHLFLSDMERQRVKLMDMIAALVGSLDQRAPFQSLSHVGFRCVKRETHQSTKRQELHH
jgi:hypothetical protein